jgi:hypothetical protein
MRLAVATTAAAVALVTVPVASAGKETSGRPAVVADAALSLAEGETVYCWASEWWVQWHRRSTVGISVWRYRLTIDDFCWTGTKIVLLNSHRSAKVNVPLWDFAGHIGQERHWNARWSFRRWTEGKFVWVGEPGLATRTPEVWFKVRGDGYLAFDAKGD